MGLIQTAEQLRFSYQAIIEGSKQLCLTSAANDSSVPFSANNNSIKSKANSPKIKRSMGIIENETNCKNEIRFGGNDNDHSMVNNMGEVMSDLRSSTTPPRSTLPPLPARARRSYSTTSQSGSTSPEPDTKKTKLSSSSVPQQDMISTEANSSANHSELSNNNSVNSKTDCVSQQTEQVEVRQRLRDERRRKTTDTIERIKKKQKESEDRSRVKKHLIKYSLYSMGTLMLLGVGFYFYSQFLVRGQLSVNSDTIAPNVDEL